MKKIFTLLVFILILTLLFAGCKGKVNTSSTTDTYSTIESSSSTDDTSSTVSSDASSDVSSAVTSDISSGNSDDHSFMPSIDSDNTAFLEKFNSNSLDSAYEEELETAFSAKEWVQISQKYANFWLSEIDNAYKCLLVEADDTASIKDEQAAWLSSCDEKIQQIESEATADGGSLARFNAANEVMLLYRERAAQLYEQLYAYDQTFTFSFVANG